MVSAKPPEQTWIFRIAHRACVPWLLRKGLVCQNHPEKDPNYVPIGNADLIDARRRRAVDRPPGGTLADYVPFYFCTHSLMLFQVHTGRVLGVTARQDEVVYLVSSIERLQQIGAKFVFSDQHAYVRGAQFFSDLADLARLDWPLIKSRDFKNDPNDPGKKERRAAECLIHWRLPPNGLLGLACRTDECCAYLNKAIADAGVMLKAVTKREWYF